MAGSIFNCTTLCSYFMIKLFVYQWVPHFGYSLRSGRWELGEGSACSHLLVFSVCSCNQLAKDLSIKEMLKSRHKDSRWLTVARGSKSVWRTVLCILQGECFKIRLKSEQKKSDMAILYILKCGRNEKYQ